MEEALGMPVFTIDINSKKEPNHSGPKPVTPSRQIEAIKKGIDKAREIHPIIQGFENFYLLPANTLQKYLIQQNKHQKLNPELKSAGPRPHFAFSQSLTYFFFFKDWISLIALVYAPELCYELSVFYGIPLSDKGKRQKQNAEHYRKIYHSPT